MFNWIKDLFPAPNSAPEPTGRYIDKEYHDLIVKELREELTRIYNNHPNAIESKTKQEILDEVQKWMYSGSSLQRTAQEFILWRYNGTLSKEVYERHLKIKGFITELEYEKQ